MRSKMKQMMRNSVKSMSMTTRRLIQTLFLLPAWVGMEGAAAAQQSARDYFEPLVSHRHFETLVRDLDLGRDQRLIVELVFTDYIDSIERLANEADAAADEAGRRTVEDALSGGAIIDPTELRRLRIAVLDVYEAYLPAVDEEYEKLTSGLRSVLSGTQRSALDAALRGLRRAVLLHPRHAERHYYEYAGDGVDILLLVDQALKHELEGIGFDALERILDTYAASLDQLLLETSAPYRISRMHLRRAKIARDADAMREAEQASVDVWEQLYTLNERTAHEVGDAAAAALGEEAREAWLSRFDRECFTWLFADLTPDLQYKWLMKQNLSDSQHAQIQQVYSEYLANRVALAGEAIRIMLRSRTDFRAIVHSMTVSRELSGGPQRLRDELIRNSGKLKTQSNATSDAFESLLDRNQRISFRNAIRR